MSYRGNRQIKPTAIELGLPNQHQAGMHGPEAAKVDTGARPEVTRDNMGHANIDAT